MTIERHDNTRNPSIALITVGLVVWFILASLAVGFVATNADSAAIQRVLNGLEGAGSSFSPPPTD
jgi:hypothetical protein